jgi:hypothetical protein
MIKRNNVEYHTDIQKFIEDQVAFSVEKNLRLKVWSRLDGEVFIRRKELFEYTDGKRFYSE